MGVGWRRFTERLYASTPLGGGDFQPTSNARCAGMLDEAKQFVQQLKKCEKAIRSMSAANSEAATAISEAMAAPLPLRYEETAAGGAGGSQGGAMIGGDAFSSTAMVKAVQEAERKVEAEVLSPLTRWVEVHNQLQTRYSELESLRLEVDSRRRTVAELEHKVDSLRVQLSSKGADAKAEASLEQLIKKLQHKEGKLQVAAQSYADHEQLLHRDLSTLLTDARWLRHYAAAGLRLEGNALLGAADAFGPLPSPSPPARKVTAPPPSQTAEPAQPLASTSGPAGSVSRADDQSPTTPDVGQGPPLVARFPVTAEAPPFV